ncbi:MAG: hypothetical protein IKC03_09210 [Oscillospiraceae bacterium]|nr:hypothetical protein [Oscillospiraceae bacterium]
MDTSAISNLLSTSLGAMTLEKLLSSALTLIVCLIAIRVVTSVVTRITAKISLDARIKKYILSGVKTILYLLTVLIVADSI